MELTEREIEIIFNALGFLHDDVIDGVYEYHSTAEILELRQKFYEKLKNS